MSSTFELTVDSDELKKFNDVLERLRQFYGSFSVVKIDRLNFTDEQKEKLSDDKFSAQIIIEDKLPDFYKNTDKTVERLTYKYNGKTIIEALNEIDSACQAIDLNNYEYSHDFLNVEKLVETEEKFKSAILLHEEKSVWFEIFQQEIKNKVSDTFEGIERAKIAFENEKITVAYKTTYQQLETDANKLQTKFYWAIGVGSVCAISIIYCKAIQPDGLNYWFLKFLIFALTITLSTYFLRRSVHLRKQSDQLKKEAWEMDALPVFIASLDKSVRDEVIKELVPKYFAKELDQSINDKMADLVNEQIRTSLEVFKTGTEIVKSLKPSAAKGDDSEAKDKNRNK